MRMGLWEYAVRQDFGRASQAANELPTGREQRRAAKALRRKQAKAHSKPGQNRKGAMNRRLPPGPSSPPSPGQPTWVRFALPGRQGCLIGQGARRPHHGRIWPPCRPSPRTSRWIIPHRWGSAVLTMIATTGRTRGEASSRYGAPSARMSFEWRLRDLVCSGKLNVRTAQQAIAAYLDRSP